MEFREGFTSHAPGAEKGDQLRGQRAQLGQPAGCSQGIGRSGLKNSGGRRGETGDSGAVGVATGEAGGAGGVEATPGWPGVVNSGSRGCL